MDAMSLASEDDTHNDSPSRRFSSCASPVWCRLGGLCALSGHHRIDRRSLELHRAIAAKLRQQPGLLAVAAENLDRWQAGAGRSAIYLKTWREIVDGPFEELLRLIVVDDERMTALRQASPFAGVLVPKERWAIYRQFERPQV